MNWKEEQTTESQNGHFPPLQRPLKVTKFDFLLFSGIFAHFSLIFSLAATHPKYTSGPLPILAHTQRDVRAAAKPEADSQTLKSLAILDKNRVREADFVDLEKHPRNLWTNVEA